MIDLSTAFDKLVVIEGSDGSGKTIQSALLCNYLLDQEYDAHLLDFPDYESKTGQLVKEMLSGEFGTDASMLNPYFTSPMYGIDRYQKIKKVFEENGCKQMDIGICNRYTMSNLIHQGARIGLVSELMDYLKWLEDFEFNRLSIPKPLCTIYLEVPFEVSSHNVISRAKENHTETDINETTEYLRLVSMNVQRLKEYSIINSWNFINCYDEKNSKMRPVMDIHREVLDIVLTAFKRAEAFKS